MLTRLTDHFEGGQPHGRSLAEDEAGTRRAAKGTVGLRLRVTRFDARAKLSQNKAPRCASASPPGSTRSTPPWPPRCVASDPRSNRALCSISGGRAAERAIRNGVRGRAWPGRRWAPRRRPPEGEAAPADLDPERRHAMVPEERRERGPRRDERTEVHADQQGHQGDRVPCRGFEHEVGGEVVDRVRAHGPERGEPEQVAGRVAVRGRRGQEVEQPLCVRGLDQHEQRRGERERLPRTSESRRARRRRTAKSAIKARAATVAGIHTSWVSASSGISTTRMPVALQNSVGSAGRRGTGISYVPKTVRRCRTVRIATGTSIPTSVGAQLSAMNAPGPSPSRARRAGW